MAEKLRNKYQDIEKERDSLSSELKRVRHDYDSYVKENDQVRARVEVLNFFGHLITQIFNNKRTSFVCETSWILPEHEF